MGNNVSSDKEEKVIQPTETAPEEKEIETAEENVEPQRRSSFNVKEDSWSESSEDVDEYRNSPKRVSIYHGREEKILADRKKVYGNNPTCKSCGTPDVCLICFNCLHWFCYNHACNYCSFCIACGCEHIKVFDNGYRYKEKFLRKIGQFLFDSNRGLKK